MKSMFKASQDTSKGREVGLEELFVDLNVKDDFHGGKCKSSTGPNLASAAQVSEFSYLTFNEIADYHAVRHIGEESQDLEHYLPKINEIGQIFIDNRVHTKAGLSLIHKHFDLKEGEMKVAEQVGNEVWTVPRKVTEADKEALTPYSFRVIRNENKEPLLIPLEYVDQRNNPAMRAKLKSELKAIKNPLFLHDFLKIVEQLDVKNYFGLVLHSRDDVFVGPEDMKLETGGGNKSRKLVVRTLKRAELEFQTAEITDVAWRFEEGKNGIVVPIGTCVSIEHGQEPAEGCTHSPPKCAGHCVHGCIHPPPPPPNVCYHCTHSPPKDDKDGET